MQTPCHGCKEASNVYTCHINSIYEGLWDQSSTSTLVICVFFRDPGVTQSSIREDESKGTALMHPAQPGGVSSKGAEEEMLNSKPWIYVSFTPFIYTLLPSFSIEQLHYRKLLHATLICWACSYLQQFQLKSKQLPSCRCYLRCFTTLGDFPWCISPSHRALNPQACQHLCFHSSLLLSFDLYVSSYISLVGLN